MFRIDSTTAYVVKSSRLKTLPGPLRMFIAADWTQHDLPLRKFVMLILPQYLFKYQKVRTTAGILLQKKASR